MRDKKAFLNKKCKDIEENSSMVKTRDLLKKIRDTERLLLNEKILGLRRRRIQSGARDEAGSLRAFV